MRMIIAYHGLSIKTIRQTLGYIKDKNVINQVVKTDVNDNNIIVYRQENIPTAEMFYANVSIPTQIIQWWQINVGLNWIRVSIKFPNEHLLNQAFNGKQYIYPLE